MHSCTKHCATATQQRQRAALAHLERSIWRHYRRCDLWRHSKTITWFARIPSGKNFVFWQRAWKCMQSYHDYGCFCPAKHDIYSVLSTEGGLNVNIGHIVYKIQDKVWFWQPTASINLPLDWISGLIQTHLLKTLKMVRPFWFSFIQLNVTKPRLKGKIVWFLFVRWL